MRCSDEPKSCHAAVHLVIIDISGLNGLSETVASLCLKFAIVGLCSFWPLSSSCV